MHSCALCALRWRRPRVVIFLPQDLSKTFHHTHLTVGGTRKGESMTYYMAKTLDLTFDDAVARATEALKVEGFGIITEIDVTATFKKKLEKDFRPYRILGACNPKMAFEALSIEDKVGTMLPCNVVVQEVSPGKVEVAAIDPVASMQAIHNPKLTVAATEVRARLRRVIDSL